MIASVAPSQVIPNAELPKVPSITLAEKILPPRLDGEHDVVEPEQATDRRRELSDLVNLALLAMVCPPFEQEKRTAALIIKTSILMSNSRF